MVEYQTKKRYKIGLVGAGNVSGMHLEGMIRHPELVEIHAVCDPVEQNRLEKSTKYQIPNSYETVEAMLQGTIIDAAVVCTPTFLREEVLLQLMKAGIPVFCEKPIAENYESAVKIANWSREFNVPIAVDQNFRRFFTFHMGRELLQKGTLGVPLHITQVVNGWRRDKGWRMGLERYVMAVMSNHWFDGYRYLLQDEAETIYCRGVKNETGQDVSVSVILQFKKGTVVSLTESFNSRARLNGAIVECEKGSLVMDYKQATEINVAGDKQEYVNTFDKSEATFYLLYDLLRSVEENRQPETGIFDNLHSLKLMEAAYQSLASGQVIRLDEFYS
ncbi:Gfo/Idh/MocA family protein [Paenibacillus agricola]|uniref:Gfo/Idh/MocA family oxidoreductase n=1 Tax=Paenibacillus agricola TaxID=2716264 RepID=A0ABX0J942_9BACL|nr:Gfo/Idh/MocA family oxidoreductase [Paenibacillus agricola]NHN32672.1 Gfo/Idh/MocA family oxidoreductase [Paenibacillus agricola]